MNNDIGEVPDLPAGWAWASVVDFKGISGLLTDGDWILSKEFLTGDEVRLIQLGDIGEGYFLDKTSKRISCKRAKELNCTFLADGDVLISRMAHPLARACQLPSLQYKCITAVDVSILRPDEDYFDGKYIKWLFNARGVRQQAEALSSGTTRKRISRKNLEIVSVPIPPLNEQHRIVAKVEELFTNLDAGVEALKKVQAQVKRYRQAVLKNAFEGKLTAEWREAHKDELEPASVLLERIREERKKKLGSKYKEPPTIDTASLQELPETWEWIPVGTVTESMTNGLYKPTSYYKEDGTASLRMYNIEGGRIIWSGIRRVQLTQREIENYKLEPGDILVNRVNSSELVGKAAVIPEGLETCVFESMNIRLSPALNLISSKYLNYWFLLNNHFYFSKNYQQTTGAASISQKQLASMEVPFTAVAEQQKIVDAIELKFSIADEAEKVINWCIKQSNRLRQSITEKAFEGKLVPQDPSDEPAELLLERIKSKREKQAVESKKVKSQKCS